MTGGGRVIEGRTKGVFALRPYQPSVRRVYRAVVRLIARPTYGRCWLDLLSIHRAVPDYLAWKNANFHNG